MPTKNKKVGVALSGGVDSSVACALLKKQGFIVIGLHMKLFPGKIEKRVKEIGKVLAIKVFIFDFQKEFKKIVIDYFLAELKKGRTPNPCVVCNAKIKFGLLLKKAKEMGCDYLATGHYVQKIKSQKSKVKNTNQKSKLLTAKCREKDQTYFLWQLKQNQLKHVLFPLGEIESKQKVRELAKEFGLPTYKTPESNDVCFLQGANTFVTIVQKVLAGKILTKDGEVVGEHKGLWFYTIGQRKGININLAGLPRRSRAKPAFALAGFGVAKAGLPWFVVGKNIKKNELVVSQDQKDLLKKELIAKEVNWIFGIEPELPLKVLAKVRYGTAPSAAIIKEKTGLKKYKVVFAQPQRAITPGQSVVWYLGDELLGGGIIK